MTPTRFIGLAPSYSAANEWCAIRAAGSIARTATSAMKVVLILDPPQIGIISGRHRYAHEAEAEIAETQCRTEIMIALRHAEHFYRIGPGSPADDRQRNTRAALISR